MPAQKIGPLMAQILDYIGVEKHYTESESDLADVSMPRVTGVSLAEAKQALDERKLSFRTVGGGDTVTAQVPSAGTAIPGGSTVILYLGEEPAETVVVPDVSGLSYEGAKTRLENAGLFMRASGSSTYYGNSSKVQSQSVAGGESVAAGTIINVEFATPQIDDGYLYTG